MNPAHSEDTLEQTVVFAHTHPTTSAAPPALCYCDFGYFKLPPLAINQNYISKDRVIKAIESYRGVTTDADVVVNGIKKELGL